MVTIYNRLNPWQAVSVFTLYGVLSAILLLAILGVYFDASFRSSEGVNYILLIFRGCSLAIKVLVSLILSYLSYTNQRINLNFTSAKKFFQAVIRRKLKLINIQSGQVKSFFKPDKPKRLLIIIVWNVFNLILSLVTVILYKDLTYLEGLLMLMILNTLFFMILYVALKKKYNEHIAVITYLLMFFSAFAWIPALIFFSIKRKNDEISPANSREKNEECRFARFYDEHDMWHFFGAVALFFTLMILMTLDDDLKKNPKSEQTNFRVYKQNHGVRPITMANEY
jgi:predicted membrane channel-forming protein YqfA (hemolysin III family)